MWAPLEGLKDFEDTSARYTGSGQVSTQLGGKMLWFKAARIRRRWRSGVLGISTDEMKAKGQDSGKFWQAMEDITIC